MSRFTNSLIAEPWGVRVRLSEPLPDEDRKPFVAELGAMVEVATAERSPGVVLVDLRGYPVGEMETANVVAAVRRMEAARVPRCAVVVNDWDDARAFAGLANEIDPRTILRIFNCAHRGEPAIAVAWLLFDTPVPDTSNWSSAAPDDEEP